MGNDLLDFGNAPVNTNNMMNQQQNIHMMNMNNGNLNNQNMNMNSMNSKNVNITYGTHHQPLDINMNKPDNNDPFNFKEGLSPGFKKTDKPADQNSGPSGFQSKQQAPFGFLNDLM